MAKHTNIIPTLCGVLAMILLIVGFFTERKTIAAGVALFIIALGVAARWKKQTNKGRVGPLKFQQANDERENAQKRKGCP